MRIIFVTIGSLFAALICFWIIKLWGQSQVYTEYRHPMYNLSSGLIEFTKPSYKNLEKDILEKEFLYLDVAISQDQKIVAPKKDWPSKDRPMHYTDYAQMKDDVVLLQDFKDVLKNKKIIFNIVGNSTAVHENFVHNMKQLGLERGDNFIVTSPYEAPIKALKELEPSYLFATTQPEILKIVAMQSMYLIEAVNIRSDFVIHPLQIRGQEFFNDGLLKELQRRHKRAIVGPITVEQKEKAVKYNPYGLVIQD